MLHNVKIKQIVPIPDDYTVLYWDDEKKQLEDSVFGGIPTVLALFEDEEGYDGFSLMSTDFTTGLFDIQGVGDEFDNRYMFPIKSARCLCKAKMEVEPIKLEGPFDDFDINDVNYFCPYCRMRFNRRTGFSFIKGEEP